MLEKCRALLQNSNFTFEPDFEALGEKLKAGKGAREDWESNLGEFARLYFEGFRDVLEREKFGVDDLLREGLEEGVPAGVLRLRVVDKLTPSGYYNEIVLEEGVLVMQVSLKDLLVPWLILRCRLRLRIGVRISVMLRISWWISCNGGISVSSLLCWKYNGEYSIMHLTSILKILLYSHKIPDFFHRSFVPSPSRVSN